VCNKKQFVVLCLFPMQESSDLIGILLALILQIVLAGSCFLGFSILRPLNTQVYEPRTLYGDKKPEKLNSQLFSWIAPIINYQELQRVHELDMDAIVFLRFVKLGFKFFGGLSFASIPLIVVHIYAPNIVSMDFLNLDDDQLANPSLSRLSITNVPQGSLLFYVHALLAYLYSFWAYFLLYRAWKEYIELRQVYFELPEYVEQENNRTLLLTFVPPRMQSEEAMKEYTHSLNLELAPAQIFFGRDYMSLPKWIEEHRKVTEELEALIHNCTFC
jgi:hypothetical protein